MMDNELEVRYKWQDQELTLTKEDVRNLISTSPNVTDKEVVLFMKLCQYQQLNPFIREAYLIKFGNSPANLVTGVEVFTKRAENSPDFDGIVRTNNYSDTDDRNKWWSQVDIYRKNLAKPITTRVYYEEYVGTDKFGNVTKMWKSKARTMLDKVALMQGLRLAFPTALGGLYEEHELDQKEVPKDISPKDKEQIPIENEIHVQGEKAIEKESEAEEVEKEDLPPGIDDETQGAITEGEIVKEEKEEEEMMNEHQETFIKSILLNHILTEQEKKNLRKVMGDGISKKLADEIIKKYKKIKAQREDDGQTLDYVSLIMAQKKKFFVPAQMIKKWAGINKMDDLQGVPTNVLEEVLEKAKSYHE